MTARRATREARSRPHARQPRRSRRRSTADWRVAGGDESHPLLPLLACHRLDTPPSGYAPCAARTRFELPPLLKPPRRVSQNYNAARPFVGCAGPTAATL
jgi:hypothetical protein